MMYVTPCGGCDDYNIGVGMHTFGPQPTGAGQCFPNNPCSGVGDAVAFQNGNRDGLLSFRIPNALNEVNTPLNRMQSTLETILASDKLDEKQKEKVQRKLDEVKAKKEEIAKKTQNASNMTVEELEALLGEIEASKQDILTFGEGVASFAKEMTEIIKKAIEKEQKAAEDEAKKASGGSSAGSSGETTTIGEGDGEKEVDTKTGRPASLGDAPSTRDLDKIKDLFDEAADYQALGFLRGTDVDKMKEVLGSLDKSNIIEFMSLFTEEAGNVETQSGFNSSYGGDSHSYSVNRGTFIWKLLAEGEHYEKKEWGKHVLDALLDRAAELGIEKDEDIVKYSDDAKKEFKAWSINKARVGDNIMKIYEAIKKKEEANVTAAKTKTDNAKAEEDKKAEEAKKEEEAKITEQKNLFNTDMQEIWGDKDLVRSEKVEYVDGKFRIRIKGETYEGSSFKELAKAVEDAGYDPKEYLGEKAAK